MLNVRRTNEQEDILSKLYEIFGYDKNIIISVCESQDWQIENCIEKLVNYNENDLITEKIIENVQTNSNFAAALKNENKEINKTETQILNKTQDPNSINLGAVPKSIISVERKLSEFIPNQCNIKEVSHHILCGHKIMLIMRGAPGSGKTHLAKQIVKLINPADKYDCKSFICSTDDYFYDINDRYIYQPDKLSDAHEFNQRRVSRKAFEGWSPIIVDNTNIKIWEMLPYVQIAVKNGYLVEIVEPNTPWSNSASKLALKNKHSVSKESIRRMLTNYEPADKNQLLKMMRSTQYTVSLPQLRRYPPIEENTYDTIVKIENVNSAEQSFENQDIQSHISWFNLKQDHYLASDKSNAETDVATVINKNLNINPVQSNLFNKLIENKHDNINKFEMGETNNQIPVHVEKSKFEISCEVTKPYKEYFPFNNNDFKKYNNTLTSWIHFQDSESKSTQIETKDDREQSHPFPEKDTINDIEDCELIQEEWVPYESESNEFWNNQKVEIANKFNLPKPQRNNQKTPTFSNETLYRLLRDPEEKNIQIKDSLPEKDLTRQKLEIHSLDCPNENASFCIVRQICPDKNINGLWDLFEKCNGNAQWVLDILLKDETSVENTNNESENSNFNCSCKNDTKIILDTENFLNQNSENMIESDFLKPKIKKERKIPEELLKLKDTIEKRVVIDDSAYSEKLRRVRNTKHPLENNIPTTSANLQNNEDENFAEEFTEETTDEEMIEVDLGGEFIQQLEKVFGPQPTPNLKTLKTNIFMPKSLGKQLYALWMESIYNQLEEEKHEILKKDEDFAILLQSSSQSNNSKPETYKDILDMELAWSIYKANPEKWKTTPPQNLASHLAHSKLCENFPDIESETLLQILRAHDNSYSQAVKALQNSMGENCSDELKEKKNSLFKLANEETEDNSKAILFPDQNNFLKKLSSEEKKKAALRDFEECRNLAAHHSQLKAECYEKAKEAIQKGNSAVAVYYSQISNLHKNKIDFYNHKAANCIMEVHDLKQNNPDIIDLHYLYTMEALECLDIFLDNHILKLRNINRPYKYIFIITGRGLHSAKGVSTIKNKVKSRLKDRTLKWSEVNPGLLKVKVFSASKFSKNS